MVHPAARAGAALRVIMAEGKFHGVIAAVTPTGCLRVTMRRLGVGELRVCPATRLASSPNHSQNDAACLFQEVCVVRHWSTQWLGRGGGWALWLEWVGEVTDCPATR